MANITPITLSRAIPANYRKKAQHVSYELGHKEQRILQSCANKKKWLVDHERDAKKQIKHTK